LYIHQVEYTTVFSNLAVTFVFTYEKLTQLGPPQQEEFENGLHPKIVATKMARLHSA